MIGFSGPNVPTGTVVCIRSLDSFTRESAVNLGNILAAHSPVRVLIASCGDVG